MISDASIGLLSGVIGAVIGSISTWYLTTAAERNRVRREALVKAGEALEAIRISYAQYHLEYPLDSLPIPGTGKPDVAYLELERALDKDRGRLRLLHKTLWAQFPERVISPFCLAVMEVLVLSFRTQPQSIDEVDAAAEKASRLIPGLVLWSSWRSRKLWHWIADLWKTHYRWSKKGKSPFNDETRRREMMTEEDGMDQGSYTNYRKTLIDMAEHQTHAYDKTLVAASGGALALSMTFINGMTSVPAHIWLLATCWITLGLSLAAVLLSMYTSLKAIDRERNIVDAARRENKWPEEQTNGWSTATGRLNTTSLFAFLLGALLLVLFCYSNLSMKGKYNDSERKLKQEPAGQNLEAWQGAAYGGGRATTTATEAETAHQEKVERLPSGRRSRTP